ncbi:repeat-containing protein [Musa troglodytarum]|uniref:Repeat-containing protein n=1 Tax=Musa troglodytarum TaxID=320322 RepID=A0A9E7JRN0_9LILI|nr:repeat-containing protein [Musa troglodytarum]
MYGKSGRIDYASRVFESMNSRNEFSWNSMISGYARHGNGDKALKVFREMQQWGQEPDLVTFVGVLSACSHAGLVEEGSKYFESMKNHGLVPQMEHYSCMIDILGRTGKLNEMEDFIKKMPVRPNNLIWRTVLVACRRSKDGAKSGIWKQASEMLLELEPENPVKSHPNTEEIYAKLHVLIQKIRDAGYVPQAEFALYDIDMETKEELLSYHSEKLAVAFVLTRSCRVPIRIMKNLRVCGDCHSAFCYISKIVGRKITLRDCNRFHHFENGKCSCGDFW